MNKIIIIFVLFFIYSFSAFSQDQNDRDFSVQLYEPVVDPNGYWGLESTQTPGHLSYNYGIVFNYQHNPLVIYSCRLTDDGCDYDYGNIKYSVVGSQLNANIVKSLVLFNRFVVGLDIPINLYIGGDEFISQGINQGLSDNVGMGDMRLILKGRIIGQLDRDGFSLALALNTTFPTSNIITNDNFMGDGFLQFHPHAIFEYKINDFSAGVSIGYYWREDKEFLFGKRGDEITFRLGLSYFIAERYRIIGEFWGSNMLSSGLDATPLQFILGGSIRLSNFIISAGGGAGLTPAIGTPQFRLLAGLSWVNQRSDRDNDRIEDSNDRCPEEPEDHDNFEDEDGCPDNDNDRDGIPDSSDRCPDEPEDMDNFEDQDGCPDPDNDNDGLLDPSDRCPDEEEDRDDFDDLDGCPDPDNDHDRIPDSSDRCPTEEEDRDNFDDLDGCPDNDNDNDRLLDSTDGCANAPEDFDNFEDQDGCPDLDNDHDGILDVNDRCSNEAENLNGVNDEDGCPDAGQTLVKISQTLIEVNQQINFATDSDKIIGQRSFKILNIITTVLKQNPQIRLRIEGHTDDRGSREHNLDLSKRRAESVKTYLIKQGINESRLDAQGFGPDRPIAPNNTQQGRTKNRRVEFHIIN